MVKLNRTHEECHEVKDTREIVSICHVFIFFLFCCCSFPLPQSLRTVAQHIKSVWWALSTPSENSLSKENVCPHGMCLKIKYIFNRIDGWMNLVCVHYAHTDAPHTHTQIPRRMFIKLKIVVVTNGLCCSVLHCSPCLFVLQKYISEPDCSGYSISYSSLHHQQTVCV